MGNAVKTVAQKCMAGNNIPQAGIDAVNSAIDGLPNFRRDRRLGVLAKAACDTAVSSACSAGGVPPAVCNCFKKDLSAKCQSYITRRELVVMKKKASKDGKKDKKKVAKKAADKKKGGKRKLVVMKKKANDGKKDKKKLAKKAKKAGKSRRLGAKAVLKTVAKKCM